MLSGLGSTNIHGVSDRAIYCVRTDLFLSVLKIVSGQIDTAYIFRQSRKWTVQIPKTDNQGANIWPSPCLIYTLVHMTGIQITTTLIYIAKMMMMMMMMPSEAWKWRSLYVRMSLCNTFLTVWGVHCDGTLMLVGLTYVKLPRELGSSIALSAICWRAAYILADLTLDGILLTAICHPTPRSAVCTA